MFYRIFNGNIGIEEGFVKVENYEAAALLFVWWIGEVQGRQNKGPRHVSK